MAYQGGQGSSGYDDHRLHDLPQNTSVCNPPKNFWQLILTWSVSNITFPHIMETDRTMRPKVPSCTRIIAARLTAHLTTLTLGQSLRQSDQILATV